MRMMTPKMKMKRMAMMVYLLKVYPLSQLLPRHDNDKDGTDEDEDEVKDEVKDEPADGDHDDGEDDLEMDKIINF